MFRGGDVVPLNIDPNAPSLENMLVPVPVVFSPAAGCNSPSISPSIDACESKGH